MSRKLIRGLLQNGRDYLNEPELHYFLGLEVRAIATGSEDLILRQWSAIGYAALKRGLRSFFEAFRVAEVDEVVCEQDSETREIVHVVITGLKLQQIGSSLILELPVALTMRFDDFRLSSVDLFLDQEQVQEIAERITTFRRDDDSASA